MDSNRLKLYEGAQMILYNLRRLSINTLWPFLKVIPWQTLTPYNPKKQN